ncbi:unnamed protein product [Arabidopsis thaliana]|uniref:At2g18970 n=2 Tax=Arabidopsis thaliana TaxID=3702 RepID=O64627_ARATH|nr:uncharacterized protein AT2G18970 [Arabidopsis thaliana]AAC09032.1 unknown protein [Arabidopsis thaliana]AAY17408.1 At2g18970 [Arabidopsis thaliana]AAY57311.1 At2g18970 [Arabidopsis thaliana]AEC06834.1 hypothetical protein AT2G18970 [Arabidopsis thaliana]CAA0365813.1 unnamed protein product [Arabidopsis thaliana]|eukprot:NP_179487.1 hypothetical protein AT2G18970 [Arabidopsis thaliana]
MRKPCLLHVSRVLVWLERKDSLSLVYNLPLHVKFVCFVGTLTGRYLYRAKTHEREKEKEMVW